MEFRGGMPKISGRGGNNLVPITLKEQRGHTVIVPPDNSDELDYYHIDSRRGELLCRLLVLGRREIALGELPNNDTCRDTHVQGVLGAILRYLQAAITLVNHFLVNAFHLIAQYNGVTLPLFWAEVLQLF